MICTGFISRMDFPMYLSAMQKKRIYLLHSNLFSNSGGWQDNATGQWRMAKVG